MAAWPARCYRKLPKESIGTALHPLPGLPLPQPKYLRRWVDLSAVWFKHSKARGNLRCSVEAAGLQCEGTGGWQGRGCVLRLVSCC